MSRLNNWFIDGRKGFVAGFDKFIYFNGLCVGKGYGAGDDRGCSYYETGCGGGYADGYINDICVYKESKGIISKFKRGHMCGDGCDTGCGAIDGSFG